MRTVPAPHAKGNHEFTSFVYKKLRSSAWSSGPFQFAQGGAMCTALAHAGNRLEWHGSLRLAGYSLLFVRILEADEHPRTPAMTPATFHAARPARVQGPPRRPLRPTPLRTQQKGAIRTSNNGAVTPTATATPPRTQQKGAVRSTAGVLIPSSM